MNSKDVPLPKDQTINTYVESESKAPRFLTSALYSTILRFAIPVV